MKSKIYEVLKPKSNIIGMFDHLSMVPAFTKKLSVGLIFLSAFIGAQYHENIQRIEDFIFQHNIQIEDNYFRDPAGLYLENVINESGNKEVYLSYSNGKKVPIYHDMLPSNIEIFNCLSARIDKMDKKEYNVFKQSLYDLLE